jgi:hypothetical protein
MRFQFIAVLLIASLSNPLSLMAITPIVAISAAQAPTTPVTPASTILVPQGTSVPLTLVSPIKSKSTRVGDTVRAVVAFPVTVGTQLAIPAGTYVEGMVTAVTARAPHTHLPSVQIHFTRLLFANGYSVPLDAANTDARMTLPITDPRATYELAFAGDGAPFLGEGVGAAGQTLPPLPPLPRPGPNPAVVGGAIGGGFVAILVALLVTSRHHVKNTDFLLFDNGWQFQMVLNSPLTLDAGKVSAAAAMPAAQ